MNENREQVVAAITESLPEFCRRNGVTLTDTQMSNLAWWVAGVIPPGLHRQGCGPWAWEEGEGFLCACMGSCQTWVRSVRRENLERAISAVAECCLHPGCETLLRDVMPS